MLYGVVTADKLLCTAITGKLGEKLELSSHLEAYPLATKWLSCLEKGMRNSLAEKLQATVQARLEGESRQDDGWPSWSLP